MRVVNIPYYQVDAFTGRLFAGNPAGVCLLADWLPDTALQSIALENNLSETAFVMRRETWFDLRWFTPAVEVDLCGHATLAAAHVLYEHLGWRASGLEFRTRSGTLAVAREGNRLTLDFPARSATACEAPEDLIREVVGQFAALTPGGREGIVRVGAPEWTPMVNIPAPQGVQWGPGAPLPNSTLLPGDYTSFGDAQKDPNYPYPPLSPYVP